jgi:hypothetical protein
MNLQTDEAGTLTLEFSQDGTNWSKYPVTEFTIAAGINEVHTAWKGGRYVRPKYTGTDGSKTYFRLQIYYSNHPLPLSAPLNQSIGIDQDATVVRAVNEGLNANSTYTQKPISSVVNTLSWVSGSDLPFSASQVWTSDWATLEGYAGLTVLADGVAGSPAPGTMSMQFSHNAIDVHRNISVTTEDIANTAPRTLGAVAKYFRLKYENGSVAHDWTDIQTMFQEQQVQLVSRLNDSISANIDVTNVRSVLVGSDNAGNYRNSTVDEHGDLKAHIHEPTTAFGELMTADMEPVIQITFPYNINTDIVTPVTSSTNTTITQANQMAVLSTSATSGNSGSLESVRTAKYRAGQGIDVRFTALFTTGSSAGSMQMAGIGDENDGVFVGYSGSYFGLMRVDGGVYNFISQSDWNTDIFDGSGNLNNPSGVQLKPEKGNVYNIKYQWLGYGAIKLSIEDPVEGFFSEATLIEYANAYTVPSFQNPTFPMRYYVSNGPNSEDIVLKTASGAAFIGGQNKITGPTNSTGSVVGKSAGTQLLFAIEGVEFMPSGSSNVNKVNSYLRDMSISNDGANNTVVGVELRENATISGSTYGYINENNSSVRTINGTYTTGTGKKLGKWSVPTGQALNIDLTNFDFEIRPTRNIAIILTGDASTATEVDINWAEDF